MGTPSLRSTEALVTRFGARTVLLPGLVFIGAGLLLFARSPVDGAYLVDVMPPEAHGAHADETSEPQLLVEA